MVQQRTKEKGSDVRITPRKTLQLWFQTINQWGIS